MKRSKTIKPKKFIYNTTEAEVSHHHIFCGMSFFDYDLILFSDCSRGYGIDADSLTVIGSRTAKPLHSENFISALNVSARDGEFISDFLLSEREFALIPAGERVALVWNRLFRSTGLGVAAVLEYHPRCAIKAIHNGMLGDIFDCAVSDSLICANGTGDTDADLCVSFVHSLSKIIRTLDTALTSSDAVERVNAASELAGCLIDTTFDPCTSSLDEADADALAAAFLCIFTVCRRISLTRGVSLSLDELDGRVKISVECETGAFRASADDERCLRFCDTLAARLEMPLSVGITDGRFVSEFVPYRVDPSLYGLKAGVRISYKLME